MPKVQFVDVFPLLYIYFPLLYIYFEYFMRMNYRKIYIKSWVYSQSEKSIVIAII